MYGLTPPIALGWLAFRGADVGGGVFGSSAEDPVAALGCLIGGLVLWSVAGYLLWRLAARRFRVLTGRVPIPRPVVGQESAVVPLLEGEAFRPPPRRRPRFAIAGLLALTVAIVAWGVFRGVSADQHLNQALEATLQTDPSWQLADIEAARTPVPDDQNSITLILGVWRLMPAAKVWPTQNLAQQLDELAPPIRLSHAQVHGITNDLKTVQPRLAQVAPLADRPCGRYDIAWSRNFMGTLLPHIDAQHSLRRLLWYDLMLRADRGDPDGALLDCRRLLHLGRSIGDEPLLVSQSVRNNDACNAVRGAERVLAQGEPSPEALADLQQRLAEEEAHPGLAIGLRGERACMDGVMALIQSGQLAWQNVNWFAATEDHSGRYATDTILFSLTPGAEKESRARLLCYHAALIEAARLPCAEQGAAFARLDAEADDMPVLARQLSIHGAKVSLVFAGGERSCVVRSLPWRPNASAAATSTGRSGWTS